MKREYLIWKTTLFRKKRALQGNNREVQRGFRYIIRYKMTVDDIIIAYIRDKTCREWIKDYTNNIGKDISVLHTDDVPFIGQLYELQKKGIVNIYDFKK